MQAKASSYLVIPAQAGVVVHGRTVNGINGYHPLLSKPNSCNRTTAPQWIPAKACAQLDWVTCRYDDLPAKAGGFTDPNK